jgi:transcriptional regulator with XRE-family HTH domain
MTTVALQRPAGELLREWRMRRGLSQLDLALQADVSARHLSFLETGRSGPSRAMVLRLADHLQVPLRERNSLLLAAGYAPAYPEAPLSSPQMAPVHAAVRRLLDAHQPFPALAVDRHWNLLDANASLALFTEGLAPWLLDPPANMLRATLHPEGVAPRILNLGEWRAHTLTTLRRRIAIAPDPELTGLLDELLGYPCDQPEPEIELPGPGSVAIPLRISHDAGELLFLSTHTTFGTPLDITVSELSIEAFFPADDSTASMLRDLALPRLRYSGRP